MNEDGGDLRMLGARDGFAHAMIRVRALIGQIDGHYSPRIPPRHVQGYAGDNAMALARFEPRRLAGKPHVTREAQM